ncbi:hypothetical protein [Ruegeria arenilitoris]|nr:hypothetical protein [Ruegeria arenilitoris]
MGISSATGSSLSPALSLLGSAFSEAADIMPFKADELFGFLHFRLHTAHQAKKRSRWSLGRVYNRFSGQSAEYIPLSGTQLIQTFSAAGIQAPDFIVIRGRYELRLDYAQQAYDALKKQIEV